MLHPICLAAGHADDAQQVRQPQRGAAGFGLDDPADGVRGEPAGRAGEDHVPGAVRRPGDDEDELDPREAGEVPLLRGRLLAGGEPLAEGRFEPAEGDLAGLRRSVQVGRQFGGGEGFPPLPIDGGAERLVITGGEGPGGVDHHAGHAPAEPAANPPIPAAAARRRRRHPRRHFHRRPRRRPRRRDRSELGRGPRRAGRRRTGRRGGRPSGRPERGKTRAVSVRGRPYSRRRGRRGSSRSAVRSARPGPPRTGRRR